MMDGFIRVAAVTPEVKVADPVANREAMIEQIKLAEENGADVVVFPELALTGATCGDLFLQDALLDGVQRELDLLVKATGGLKILVAAGLPFEKDGKLYDAAAVISDGKLLGVVPKMNLKNDSGFAESRYFVPGNEVPEYILWNGEVIPFGSNILFCASNDRSFKVGVEIGEDAFGPMPVSGKLAMAGASVIVNCCAKEEGAGFAAYRRHVVEDLSSRYMCGYIFSNAGEGESTQDMVFGGGSMIAETGEILEYSEPYENGMIITELDLLKIRNLRRKNSALSKPDYDEFDLAGFTAAEKDMILFRHFPQLPFLPETETAKNERLKEVFDIQVRGLKKRLAHIHAKHAVIGISGGLDSTLALLVAVKAFDILGLPRENIVCVTMPCFGTSDRTHNNALLMTEHLGCTLREINIRDAVTVHFKDIGHDMSNHDVTYENSQARERTQILMDLSNEIGGLLIGTGDMSELALGWATYNGDHMSMYGVNASVPKMLVRHLVRYEAMNSDDKVLRDSLLDVIDTPVSPELLPPEDGAISQKTEDLVGPYELHDFFLYYILRYGFNPSRIFRMAKHTFTGVYDDQTIYKWLYTFYRRFFAQQFKRSCLPDGPKTGSAALSPRGGLTMPSDALSREWLKELESMKPEETV